LDDPYADKPQSIGFNTTISSFSIHGITLENLKSYLNPGAKCIDIGTGSGFVATCFAEMVGK
jgi:protein-L-isoaspartate(D-aspartate) O-methyltransferase